MLGTLDVQVMVPSVSFTQIKLDIVLDSFVVGELADGSQCPALL